MEILELTSRGDRRKVKEVRKYRRITLDEAKALNYGDHIKVMDRHGQVADAKVNGKVKTWKRDASRIEIPCKYGLYECFTLNQNDFSDILIEL